MIFVRYNLQMTFSNRGTVGEEFTCVYKTRSPGGNRRQSATVNFAETGRCEFTKNSRKTRRDLTVSVEENKCHRENSHFRESTIATFVVLVKNRTRFSCPAPRKKNKPRNEFIFRIISTRSEIYVLAIFSRRTIWFHYFWSKIAFRIFLK